MTDNGAAAEAHADDVVKASAAPPNAGVHAPAASPSSHASDSAGASGGASSSSKKKKAKKKKKKKKKKRKKIDKEHPEFELTYDMMLGIRTTVSQVESKPPRELTRDDFEESISLRFLAEGTGETPPHKMRDFKFKDYAPQVFRHIRERFDVTPQEYLLNICGDFQFLEFISNSKSGQFFFYSENRQFMIKTISKAESKYLRRILEHYYTHVMDNPNTLLTRFFGMHRVKPHKKPQVHFLILGSVFHRSRFVHRTYDLKGSTQGRITDIPDDKDVATLVLKDNNWLHDDAKIKVGGRSAQLLTEQLASDAQFLCRLNIMDYSLLIGIHYRDRPVPGAEDDSDADDGPDADGADAADEPAPARPASNSRAFARSASERGADALQVPGPDQGRPPLSRRRSDFGRRRSRYGLPSYYDKVSKPEDIKFEAPDFGPLPLPPKEDLPGAQGEVISTVHSLFTADDGGIASEDGTEVYYMGIIDILVDYGVTKRLEHGFKSIKYNSRTISAVHPQVYAERFKEFLFKSIE